MSSLSSGPSAAKDVVSTINVEPAGVLKGHRGQPAAASMPPCHSSDKPTTYLQQQLRALDDLFTYHASCVILIPSTTRHNTFIINTVQVRRTGIE